MLKLNDLLQAIDVTNTYYVGQDLLISGVSYHSGKVNKGDLFVCIKGYKTDGHKYLGHAVQNGAVAAIVEDFQENIEIPQIQVDNARIALARLGAHYYGNPSQKMKMIGITATNGKTTTSFMTNAILENHGYKTGLVGTVVVKIDDTSVPSELTTPESLDLQRYLHQMVEHDVSHVCMEVSSAALESSRVESVEYDIVTFNNFSPEHIDHHGSVDKYFAAKSSLIKEASKNSIAVLNLDCSYSASLMNATAATPITFGVKRTDGHLYCKNLDLSTGRAKFTVEIKKPFTVQETEYKPSEFDIELNVPGLHSVYNSMVAITVALLCEVPISVIQETLKQFGGVERRFEYVYDEDIKILDDHFANPGNINVTLETLKYMDYHKLHLVYAIRGERGPTVNRENAEAIAEWSKKLNFSEIVATKSVSHVTDKDKVTAEEEKVFMDVMRTAGIKVHLFDELPDAIAYALNRAVTDDLILLCGCQGMDPGAEIALEFLREKKMGSDKEIIVWP